MTYSIPDFVSQDPRFLPRLREHLAKTQDQDLESSESRFSYTLRLDAPHTTHSCTSTPHDTPTSRDHARHTSHLYNLRATTHASSTRMPQRPRTPNPLAQTGTHGSPARACIQGRGCGGQRSALRPRQLPHIQARIRTHTHRVQTTVAREPRQR